MHKFEVWAPKPHKVAVKLGSGKVYDLQPGPYHYWSREVEEAKAGDDYSFLLDEEDTEIPDPRSKFQPNGVHGGSRIVDHSAFAWTDDRWQAPPLSGAIIYELHMGTFTAEGTFESAIRRLPYLPELGITHVEVMPVNEFPGQRGWGYDGVDLYAPHHCYGGPDGLKRFVNACHKEGLAVLLDVVYNHLGPVGNYLSKFGPYFNENLHTPWGAAVNLDAAGSTEVRRFFCDNALMWLRDYHFDGLRLDAVHAFLDQSATHFLEQLAIEVDGLEKQLERQLVLVAESDLNQPLVVTPREANGFGIDAQWSDDYHHALHAALTGERGGYYSDFGPLAQVAKALSQVFVYNGQYSEFRERIHGRPVLGLSGARFLGYLQNHDQVGNRAQGDRSSHLLSPGKLKIGAAFVLLAPFVPMLFQGEEFAASSPFQYFTDHEDLEIGKAVTEGRRREFASFGWNPEDVPDPQSDEAFQRSKLRWDEVEKEPHRSMLEWTKRLIELRRSASDFSDGRLDRVQADAEEDRRVLRMRRGKYEVVGNLSGNAVDCCRPENARVILSSEGDGSRLEPESVVIFEHQV